MRLLLQASTALLFLDLCSGEEDFPAQGLQNDSTTPFWSCCPLGGLLAIVDTSGYSSQDTEAKEREETRRPGDVGRLVADLGTHYGSEGEHQDIAEVSCVPDPDPDTRERERGFYPDTDQVFQTSGNWLPTCPGGVRQLSTIFVGKAPWGDSWPVGPAHWRMTRSGTLTVEGGRPSYSQDRQFCLTRIKNLGEQHYLRAVFCDPCKSKVMCSLLSTITWPFLKDKLEYVRDRHKTEFVFQLSPLLQHLGPKPWKMPRLRELLSISCYPHPSGNQCESDWFRVVFPHLNLGDRVNVTKEEFTSGILSPTLLVKEVFHGLDADQDGFLMLEEATPENLLRPMFLQRLVSLIFKLLDFNQDDFLTVEDDLDLSLENLRAHIYGLYLALDKNSDDRIDLLEVQDLVSSIFNYFTTSESSPCPYTTTSSGQERAPTYPCRVSRTSFLAGLDKAGVPVRVREAFQEFLLPFITFSRAVLQSLVKSSDSDRDGKMTWEELEDFSDFSLALKVWPRMLKQMLAQGQTESVAWASIFSYFSTGSNLFKISNNILYSKNFQFSQSPSPCDM